MRIRSWSALLLLLAVELTAHSIGPNGLPGVGALVGAEGLPAGELRLGFDNRVLPYAALYSSTPEREEFRALSSTQTLFASFGAGHHWTLFSALPIETDFSSSSSMRAMGIGDAQFRGLLSFWSPAKRMGAAAEFGLSMGIASAGTGMIPRGAEFLRDDQVSSPLGRRRVAALLAGAVVKEYGEREYPWRVHLRAEIYFPSKHYPLTTIDYLAVEKALPFNWSVGSDLKFGAQFSSINEAAPLSPNSLKWGLNATFKTDRNFYATGGVAWELWPEGEVMLHEGQVDRLWKPQSSIELRAQFGWMLHLKKKKLPEENGNRREEPLAPEEEIVEKKKEVEPPPFDEFDHWDHEEECSEQIEVYSQPERCFSSASGSSPLKSGLVSSITFAPGAEELSLESFAPLDSIAHLMVRDRKVGVEIVVAVGKVVALPSRFRQKFSSEELAERRAHSLVSYMMARGVKKERLKWRVVAGEGGVLFLFD